MPLQTSYTARERRAIKPRTYLATSKTKPALRRNKTTALNCRPLTPHPKIAPPPSFHQKRLPATLLVSWPARGPALYCEAVREFAEFGKLCDQLLKTQSQSDLQATGTALSSNLRSTDAIALGLGPGIKGALAEITRVSRLLWDASAVLNAAWINRDTHTSRTIENLNYVDRLVASTGCDIEPINGAQSGGDAAETSGK